VSDVRVPTRLAFDINANEDITIRSIRKERPRHYVAEEPNFPKSVVDADVTPAHNMSPMGGRPRDVICSFFDVGPSASIVPRTALGVECRHALRLEFNEFQQHRPRERSEGRWSLQVLGNESKRMVPCRNVVRK
jgi:hypothetical protein